VSSNLKGAEMETVVERPAALDVHKEQVIACARTPAAGGGREQHLAEFKTTVQGLLALRDWLKAHRVTQVAMEASGVYWKPPWAILEDEFECVLVNARHVKQVPGRKTEVSDAAWLCQLLLNQCRTGRTRLRLIPVQVAKGRGGSTLPPPSSYQPGPADLCPD
jgi:transposase